MSRPCSGGATGALLAVLVVIIVLTPGLSTAGCKQPDPSLSAKYPRKITFTGAYSGEVGPGELGHTWGLWSDSSSVMFDARSGNALIADAMVGCADFPLEVGLSLVDPAGNRVPLHPPLSGRLMSSSSIGEEVAFTAVRFGVHTVGTSIGSIQVQDSYFLGLFWYGSDGQVIYEEERKYPYRHGYLCPLKRLTTACRLVDDGGKLVAFLLQPEWDGVTRLSRSPGSWSSGLSTQAMAADATSI